jgi:hypothetical protein
MERSDYSFALDKAEDVVKKSASRVLDSNNPDDVIRLIKKVYYSRHPKKYLEKIKSES